MNTTSAVIPVYNVEKYLVRCLDSVVNQSIPFDKIIIVDDGSTDGCGIICDAYSNKYNNIIVIHKENGGLVSAWMEGLKYVDTSHICFIDSDDFVSSDYHECLVNALCDGIDMVSMQCVQYIDENHQYKLPISTLEAGIYTVDDSIKSIIVCDHGSYNRPIAICRWGKIIRSDLVMEYAKYCTPSISYGEDQQLTLGIINACRQIKLLDEYKYYYQFNPNSILNSYRKDMWEKVKLLMRTISNVPGIRNIPDYTIQYSTQYLLHMSECFRNEFSHKSFTKEYYLNVLSDEDIQTALKIYSFDKMRRIDKLICTLAHKKAYTKTYIYLFVFKMYMSIRRIMGKQL